MKKIAEITKEQFNKLEQAENKVKVFKNILNINPNLNYAVGDTGICIRNAKPLDVFTNKIRGIDFYYIIISEISEDVAMAYTLYPFQNELK